MPLIVTLRSGNFENSSAFQSEVVSSKEEENPQF